MSGRLTDLGKKRVMQGATELSGKIGVEFTKDGWLMVFIIDEHSTEPLVKVAEMKYDPIIHGIVTIEGSELSVPVEMKGGQMGGINSGAKFGTPGIQQGPPPSDG